MLGSTTITVSNHLLWCLVAGRGSAELLGWPCEAEGEEQLIIEALIDTARTKKLRDEWRGRLPYLRVDRPKGWAPGQTNASADATTSGKGKKHQKNAPAAKPRPSSSSSEDDSSSESEEEKIAPPPKPAPKAAVAQRRKWGRKELMGGAGAHDDRDAADGA